MMSHATELNLSNVRRRSLLLVGLMVLSVLVGAIDVTASNAKHYPVARDPTDLATGDFDCDGDEDIVTASDMGNFLSILWNDGGTYQERSDIWVSNNASRRQDWMDMADATNVEVGDIDGDGNDDIVFYQGNIQVYGTTEVVRGNLTVLTNPECDGVFVEDAVHTMGDIVWSFQVGDITGDGADDIVALDLEGIASGQQRLMTFIGGSDRNNAATNHKVTQLDNLASKVYGDLRLGNWGETVTQPPIGVPATDFEDLDAWMLVWPAYNPATGWAAGDWDNITVVEFDSVVNTFAAYNDPNKAHTFKVGVEYGDYDIADTDADGIIDMVAMTNASTVTYISCANAPCPSQASWTAGPTIDIGAYYGAALQIADINQDGDMDFVIPTYLSVTSLTGASGNTVTSLNIDNLNDLNTVQIILSDGSGGYHSPQSMDVGRRPTMVLVGQFVGGSSSALDLAVGNRDYRFQFNNGAWWLDTKGCFPDRINSNLQGLGGCGSQDAVTIIQLDNEDVGISSMSASPASFNPDTLLMTLGEGQRNVNVTVSNTGLDVISGSLTVEASVKEVIGGTDTLVYSNDYDIPAVSNCGGGCTWSSADYDGEGLYWHEELVGNQSSNGEGYEAGVNPTSYMWAGTMYANSSDNNNLESGYVSWQDEAIILNDVDLSGSDSAKLEVDLFCTSGYSTINYVYSNGAFAGMLIYDDSCNIDIYTDDGGWEPVLYEGGYDAVRFAELADSGYIEYTRRLIHVGGTNYSWSNFTDDSALDLTEWAGETIDIRFRFRSGFYGSVGLVNESRNTQFDGMAFDNLTITKTVTQYGQEQIVQQNVNLNNFAPGDEQVVTLNANFVNNTTYIIGGEITATSGFVNEDDTNDLTRFKTTVLNLYDPAVRGITSFEKGQLYAAGQMAINVTAEHAGNTLVDFDVEATIYQAQPNALFTNPCKDLEDFEPSNCAYMFGDDGDNFGIVVDDTDSSISNAIVPGNRPVFGSNAYWFGHPDDGYGDDWNESMTLQEIDLRNMAGDFAYLTFDYFAEADYLTDSNGDIVNVNEYAGMEITWRKGSQSYDGLVYGSWNDYNENGIQGVNQTCEDIDDDGDYDEVEFTGDHGWNVWFDSEGVVKSVTLDLTHLVIQNRSSPDSSRWRTECTSMEGAQVTLTFRFQSNSDGINGQSGFAGFAVDNITVQEYTFTLDTSYTASVSNLDAREEVNLTVGTHNFLQGIYRVDVMSIFDNVTAGNSWTNVAEVTIGNNLSRMIFEVASVDVTLLRPNVLDCVEDVSMPCAYPIDNAKTHQFELELINGVLEGDYNVFMQITDVGTGTAETPVASTNSPQTLAPHARSNATFQPYTGWQDGHTYNIQFYAELIDGTSSGNMRNFTITFYDNIDVAILSGTTDQNRLEKVKQDLSSMGMTYTQYRQGDWDDYFDDDWLSHYQKILLPWQTNANVIAGSYYQELGETGLQNTLENFMLAGGTVEMHIGPNAESDSDAGKLLYEMDILNRDTAGTQIEHDDLAIIDPYHPLLADVSPTAWLGMNNGDHVANAALSTATTGLNKLPNACSGGMINTQQGRFHSIIQHADDSTMTLLATCGIGSGGLIVTTIDVENPSVSEDYGSTAAPLRSNLLKFMVTPYPLGFGIAGAGWDLTINDEVPTEANGNGIYDFTYYMKSNTALTFGYNSTVSGLDADWHISGATDWERNLFTPNQDYAHRADESHTSTFCRIDTQESSGCRQDATWTVTLFLHDADGHTRISTIELSTNDILADSSPPVASVTVEEHPFYPDSLSDHGTKTVGAVDWPIHLAKLSSSNDVKVKFDACASQDPDAPAGETGITLYKWKVLFDYPWNAVSEQNHEFERTSAMGCDWTYTFWNQTADPSGFNENTIRIELVVVDRAGRESAKNYMFFVVVPEDWGDEPPDVQISTPLDGSTQSGDYVYVNGSVLSGSENGDILVEVSLNPDVLNQTLADKFQQMNQGKYNSTNNLCDTSTATSECVSTFSMGLKLEDLYTNQSQVQTIWVKIVEGNGQNWVLWKRIDINLVPVQDEDPCVADPKADGCSGTETQTGDGEEGFGALIIYAGIGALALLIVVLATLFMLRMRKGGSEPSEGFGGVEDMDPMEAYVQQLIAQGYPEETARQYAEQYASHFQQQ